MRAYHETSPEHILLSACNDKLSPRSTSPLDGSAYNIRAAFEPVLFNERNRHYPEL